MSYTMANKLTKPDKNHHYFTGYHKHQTDWASWRNNTATYNVTSQTRNLLHWRHSYTRCFIALNNNKCYFIRWNVISYLVVQWIESQRLGLRYTIRVVGAHSHKVAHNLRHVISVDDFTSPVYSKLLYRLAGSTNRLKALWNITKLNPSEYAR